MDCLACEAFERRRQALEERRALLPLECAVCLLPECGRWTGVVLERISKNPEQTEGR